MRLPSGEVRPAVSGKRRGLGDDVRTIDERVGVDTDHSQAVKDVGECLLELLLIVRERLPFARCARITGQQVVGLEAHLAAEGRYHRAMNAGHTWECLTAELRLDEELGVKYLRGRVEWCARDSLVNPVRCSDSVRREKPDDFEILEADIEHAGENLVDII